MYIDSDNETEKENKMKTQHTAQEVKKATQKAIENLKNGGSTCKFLSMAVIEILKPELPELGGAESMELDWAYERATYRALKSLVKEGAVKDSGLRPVYYRKSQGTK